MYPRVDTKLDTIKYKVLEVSTVSSLCPLKYLSIFINNCPLAGKIRFRNVFIFFLFLFHNVTGNSKTCPFASHGYFIV